MKSAKPTKKAKAVNLDELRKLAGQAMEDFKIEAKARHDKAHKLYVKQDDDTQDALDRMTALLVRIARRQMWVGVGGKQDRLVMVIPEETIYHNMVFMAVEILKDLAQMDVRVAGFKFVHNLCAECYAEISPKKQTVKKKVRK